MSAATAPAVSAVGRAGRRVLLLTPSLDYGGAEMVVVGLAKSLHAQGWDVSVASMLEPRAYVPELEALGIRVERLGMQAGTANLGGITRFYGLLRRVQPDLIHAHMFHANILARIFWPVMRIPVICTIQNILESSQKKNTARFRNWVYRVTDWSCDRTTAVAETVREHYVQSGFARANRIQTIPNFVDIERYHPSPATRDSIRQAQGWGSDFIWLAVGRLELAKDYPTMLNAFVAMLERGAQARLIVAGQGRLRRELEAETERRGLSSSVKWLGNRTDVPELLRAADGYVMSSAWEGASVAVMEASASGLPVVTTEAGGNAEMVVDGVTGFVVPCKDSEALRRAMDEVMQRSLSERAAMGRAGREFVEAHFSQEAVCSRYESLYWEVLQCTA